MRGLGIGVIVTALLMGVATKSGAPLSDAEIKARAYGLGMVDSDSLKLTDIYGAASGPGDTPEQGDAPGQGTVPGEGGASGQGDVPGEGGASEPGHGSGQEAAPEQVDRQGQSGESEPGDALGQETAPEQGGEPVSNPDAASENMQSDGRGSQGANPEDAENPTISIVIESGIGSDQISILLAEAGLIERADEFDNYLCSNGYSTKIRYGAYEIPLGTSEEEIIRILTGGR